MMVRVIGSLLLPMTIVCVTMIKYSMNKVQDQDCSLQHLLYWYELFFFYTILLAANPSGAPEFIPGFW